MYVVTSPSVTRKLLELIPVGELAHDGSIGYKALKAAIKGYLKTTAPRGTLEALVPVMSNASKQYDFILMPVFDSFHFTVGLICLPYNNEWKGACVSLDSLGIDDTSGNPKADGQRRVGMVSAAWRAFTLITEKRQQHPDASEADLFELCSGDASKGRGRYAFHDLQPSSPLDGAYSDQLIPIVPQQEVGGNNCALYMLSFMDKCMEVIPNMGPRAQEQLLEELQGNIKWPFCEDAVESLRKEIL
jgi:hypothetical protein